MNLLDWLSRPSPRFNYMETYSGGVYFPAAPRAQDVRIIDIAHHLSMLCRFTGAVRTFYSVAEHSVHVSHIVPPEHALAGLMHDAAEAYLNDVNRPLKQNLGDYKKIEALNWRAIAPCFGLPLDIPQCIHDADNAMLLVERARLMPPTQRNWDIHPPGEMMQAARKRLIFAAPPDQAERLFLDRFYELTRGRPYNVVTDSTLLDLVTRYRFAEGH